jgi:hypothetical protein
MDELREIRDRLARMERENRRWRALAVSAISLIGVASAAGAALQGTAPSDVGSSPNDVVKGRRFEFYQGGRVGATWENGVLSFFDAQNVLRSQFHAGGSSVWDAARNLVYWQNGPFVLLAKNVIDGERIAVGTDKINLLDANNQLKATLRQNGVTVYGLEASPDDVREATPDARPIPTGPPYQDGTGRKQ